MQVCLLRSLASQLRNACHCLAFALTLFDFILHHFRHIGMDMEVVVDILLDKIPYVLVDTLTVRRHLGGTELYLRLTLEHRLLNIQRNGCNNTVTHVGILIILVEKLFYCLGDMLLECALMRATLRGMLTIDKTMILFAILIGVRKSDFYVFSHDMYNGIEPIVRHIIIQ